MVIKLNTYVLLGLLALFNWTSAESYQDYKVYEVTAENLYQAKYLEKLENEDGYDFVKRNPRLNEGNNIMVAPDDQINFETKLDQYGFRYRIIVDNVESILEEERRERRAVPFMSLGNVTFRSYMFHSEQNAYLKRLAQDYPDIVTLENFGTSYEGREMLLLRISSGPSPNAVPKPTIFVDAGIHAREWIAPPVALYIIQQLVENPSNAALYENVDWAVIPCLNPDGYQYTQDQNRFWRKTRQPNVDSLCSGVDGNRNFGYYWMYAGASSEPCSDTYAGPEAFSAPETAALRDWILNNKDTVKLYLTFHSYGSMLLYPWGYDPIEPDDNDVLYNLALSVANAIEEASTIGTSYLQYIGPSAMVLYSAAGGSDDWVKAEGGVDLSYTIELPYGNSSFYFINPASDILPIVQETWAGMKVYHKYIEDNFWTDLQPKP